MSSNNLSLEDSGSLDISSEIPSDKETQTSSTYITDSFDLVKGPSRPLPKGFDSTDVEPPVSNILDYRVIKDPTTTESTSTYLVSESFVKEIVNPRVTTEEVGTSPSSLKYCKEVVDPYLNPYLNDCEDNTESLEKIIQDALEELPDYQPCSEIYEGEKDIQEKLNINPILRMGIQPNLNNEKEKTEKTENTEKTKNTNLPAEKDLDDTSQIKSPPNNINNLKQRNQDEVPVPENESIKETNDQNKIELTRRKSTKSISECAKNSLTAIKCSASSCLDKVETTIGIMQSDNIEEKPSYYTREKPTLDGSPFQNAQTETGNSLKSLKNLINNPTEKITTFTEACKNFAENLINNPNEKIYAIKETCRDLAGNLMNNPDEKMNTIKETCQDYADKFYKTSKEAVSLLSSESAKLLTKIGTELSSDDVSRDAQKERQAYNITVDSVTRFLFHKAENKPIKDDYGDIGEAITGPSRITAAIPPAIKQSYCRIRDDLVSSKFDKSSPYDNALPKEALNMSPDPPETRLPTVRAIDHTPDPPSSSSMFAIIRSKIFSIFRDETDKSTEIAIQENQDDDEEEDPFERFMEQ